MTFQHTLFTGETVNTVYRVDGVFFVDTVLSVGTVANVAGAYVRLYVFDKYGNIVATDKATSLSTAEAENIAEVLWKGFVEYGE